MFTNIPPVTKALLIANAVVFVLQLLLGDAVFRPFALWPFGVPGPYADLSGFMQWRCRPRFHATVDPGISFFSLCILMSVQLELVWGAAVIVIPRVRGRRGAVPVAAGDVADRPEQGHRLGSQCVRACCLGRPPDPTSA